MVDTRHVFQFSGIKDHKLKTKAVHGIKHLGGHYIGGPDYNERTTHLVVSCPSASEKFLAACAQGKWIVTPDYVCESVKNGSWLPEQPYELMLAPPTPGITNRLSVWRQKVASGKLSGAFEGWSALLLTDNPDVRDQFKRVLTAGKARVYTSPPAPKATVTHVLSQHVTDIHKQYNAKSVSLHFIAYHLLGKLCSAVGVHLQQESATTTTVTRGWEDVEAMEEGTEVIEIMDEEDDDWGVAVENVGAASKRLKAELTAFIVNADKWSRDADAAEFQCHRAPARIVTSANDFPNVEACIVCGLYKEALEDIQRDLFPGRLPPLFALSTLLDHVLQGKATPGTLAVFWSVFDRLLENNNPSWCPPDTTKYFRKLLQCPSCPHAPGLMPLLDNSIRYYMSMEGGCHVLPSPAPPELLDCHYQLLCYILLLFRWELHRQASGGPAGQGFSSVLATGFWTNPWERYTLGSRCVHQLAKLLVQANAWALSVSQEELEERNRRQRLVLVVQELLGVVVEYWCGTCTTLNRAPMQRNLEDLAEHIISLCRDYPPSTLMGLVAIVDSTRLKLVMADAAFKDLCARHKISLRVEALSVRKILTSYLPALERLCGATPAHSGALWADDEANTLGRQDSDPGMPGEGRQCSALVRGNTAGETLLHRACRGNEVDTVLELLAQPGIDVNAEDAEGWTPIHEACNHGSAGCVKVLLHLVPDLNLEQQTGEGVSPLHDALMNGHLNIAKMLLQHAGSALLHHTLWDGRGPLDLVFLSSQKEELLAWAASGDRALEVQDPLLLEAGACMLACLLGCYHKERGVPQRVAGTLGCRLAAALEKHTLRRLTAGWADSRLVRVAEDVEAAMAARTELARLGLALRRRRAGYSRVLLAHLARF